MTKIKTLNLKNYQLETLAKILDVPLHSEKARARNRFYKILKSKIDDREKARIEILERLGKLNKEKNNYEIKNVKKFNEEFEKMQNEVCIIDLLPSVKADLPFIKEILEKTKVEMNITQTEIYEEILAEIEKC